MNVTVVGIGYWGSKVLDEYVELREDDEVDQVIACDVDETRLRNVTEADRKVTDIREALEKVDAVHVCTSNDTHYEIAERALTQGKDVLVEKPLTTDRDRAYDLVELASETGQILQTGHIFRFADIVRYLKKKYEQGYFGDVYHFNVRWTHRMEPREGTDVLWDLLPHPIDVLNFITGEWPKQPTGTTHAPQTSERAEAAYLQCQIDDAYATMEVSWLSQFRRRLLEISGSERSVRANCTEQTAENKTGDDVEHVSMDNNTIEAEIRNFIESIETGKNTFNSAIVGARTVDSIQTIAEKTT